MNPAISFTQFQSSVSDFIINDKVAEDKILEEPQNIKVRIVPFYVFHDLCVDEISSLNILKEENTLQSGGRQNKTKYGLKIYQDCLERDCAKKLVNGMTLTTHQSE